MIPEEGKLLLVDKPLTWTSFDVVKKLKYTLRPKKIGHAGTLDPLATGLLLIGVNKFTKKLHELQGLDKTYLGVMEIGKTTPSYDLETEFDSEQDWQHLKAEEIEKARLSFLGEIKQVPPAHSAIRVDGQRAYQLARRNEEVKLKERTVTIKRFDLELDLPLIRFEVECTKGTYIRSLVNDFGHFLSVGAYLKELRRTRIGVYDIKNAYQLDSLIKEIENDKKASE